MHELAEHTRVRRVVFLCSKVIPLEPRRHKVLSSFGLNEGLLRLIWENVLGGLRNVDAV